VVALRFYSHKRVNGIVLLRCLFSLCLPVASGRFSLLLLRFFLPSHQCIRRRSTPERAAEPTASVRIRDRPYTVRAEGDQDLQLVMMIIFVGVHLLPLEHT
jgi:hypothetical protein